MSRIDWTVEAHAWGRCLSSRDRAGWWLVGAAAAVAPTVAVTVVPAVPTSVTLAATVFCCRIARGECNLILLSVERMPTA